MKRRPVENVPELAYPTCEGEPLPEGEVLASGTLRAGELMRERDVIERWEMRRRGCVYVATVRQQWASQVTDVEVIFDLEWTPLRAWKRMMIPGARTPPDTRLYELRNDPPTMSTDAEHVDGVEHREFAGRNPIAVVGPGRALLAAWVRAANLEVGDVARGNVLDFRQLVERIEEVALRRDPDRDDPELGRVRVYTVFGRESFFVNEEGWVVGDLAGLRDESVVSAPAPEELPVPAADPSTPLAN